MTEEETKEMFEDVTLILIMLALAIVILPLLAGGLIAFLVGAVEGTFIAITFGVAIIIWFILWLVFYV